MSGIKSIAFLCHPYHRGGVTRWMADAAIAYAAMGLEVYFLTLEPSVTFYSGKGRETMTELLRKKPNTVKVVSDYVGREFEFGLPSYCTYVYKKLISKHLPLGTPIILSDDPTVWRSAVELKDSYPIVGVLHADDRPYYDYALQYVNDVPLFVTVSNRITKTVFVENKDFDKKKIFTIPCGIELHTPDFRTTANDKLVIVYVGRISDYQKRSGDLLKVAEALHALDCDFELNIIGDGEAARVDLEKKVKASAIADKIIFRGWLSQKEVHNWLVKADAMLMTSDFEGTPIAMMEALAAGCGFVGTRVSGIEDCESLPEAKDCFRVFDVGDIEDAANKLQQIAAIPLMQRQQAARAIAESKYSMEKCLADYLDAIQTIPSATYTKPSASISIGDLLQSKLRSSIRSLKMMMSK